MKYLSVIPAQVGMTRHFLRHAGLVPASSGILCRRRRPIVRLDSRLRGNDDGGSGNDGGDSRNDKQQEI